MPNADGIYNGRNASDCAFLLTHLTVDSVWSVFKYGSYQGLHVVRSFVGERVVLEHIHTGVELHMPIATVAARPVSPSAQHVANVLLLVQDRKPVSPEERLFAIQEHMRACPQAMQSVMVIFPEFGSTLAVLGGYTHFDQNKRNV